MRQIIAAAVSLVFVAGVAECQVLPAANSAWPDLELSGEEGAIGSPCIPMDSWIYPAMSRLAGLGYVDTAFAGLRPWTRMNVANMLAETSSRLTDHVADTRTHGDAADEEATALYLALAREVGRDVDRAADTGRFAQIDAVYSRAMGIGGTPLRDSFHVGSTIVNDYGRPYASGFNNSTGFAGSGVAGRFSVNFRGEYQHAPTADGYSVAVADTLSTIDGITPYHPDQDTIPLGPVSPVDTFGILEADASMHIWGHEFSFGKQDAWWGPGKGGAYAYSNNAENIYSFRIDRVEPLRIPLLSRVTGPFRYQFLVGSLKGHTDFRDPWVHAEKISFKPTPDSGDWL